MATFGPLVVEALSPYLFLVTLPRGSHPSPPGRLEGNQSWGQLTRKGNTLYAIVYNWPTNGVLDVPVKGAPTSAIPILGGGSVAFKTSATGVDITVPTTMPASPATVIQINFSGSMSA